jgi:hypothetical protein
LNTSSGGGQPQQMQGFVWRQEIANCVPEIFFGEKIFVFKASAAAGAPAGKKLTCRQSRGVVKSLIVC